MSLRIILLSSLFMIFTFGANAEVLPKKWETITFKVYGNCEMCKKTIESALKGVEGVKFAVWSEKTKKITVKYNPSLITLDKIHTKIAAVGYDTERMKAKDETYKKLHTCCQYERPKNN